MQSLLSKHHTSLERLFLSSILLKCDGYLLRTVASSCLTRLLNHAPQNVSNFYHDLLKFLEAREINAKIAGLQWYCDATRCERRNRWLMFDAI